MNNSQIFCKFTRNREQGNLAVSLCRSLLAQFIFLPTLVNSLPDRTFNIKDLYRSNKINKDGKRKKKRRQKYKQLIFYILKIQNTFLCFQRLLSISLWFPWLALVSEFISPPFPNNMVKWQLWGLLFFLFMRWHSFYLRSLRVSLSWQMVCFVSFQGRCH